MPVRKETHHYLLKKEFEEHDCSLKALNDRGDDSPEGGLTDGILDQLARYERAKTVERSRRGKLRKAREGKVIATYRANYGFRLNHSKDGYEVDEEEMAIVRRVFRMVGEEGVSLHGVVRTLEAEEVNTPGEQRYWNKRVIKRWILNDVYKPHVFEEIASCMTPDVATQLDPHKLYGIWWFNRRTAGARAQHRSPRWDRTAGHTANGVRFRLRTGASG